MDKETYTKDEVIKIIKGLDFDDDTIEIGMVLVEFMDVGIDISKEDMVHILHNLWFRGNSESFKKLVEMDRRVFDVLNNYYTDAQIVNMLA